MTRDYFLDRLEALSARLGGPPHPSQVELARGDVLHLIELARRAREAPEEPFGDAVSRFRHSLPLNTTVVLTIDTRITPED